MGKGGISIKFGDLKNYRVNARGVREMMRTHEMQSTLVATAEDIAATLNATNDGTYDVGPYGEGVTSSVGAHAFVRTADIAAQYEQVWYDTLNQAIGG